MKVPRSLVAAFLAATAVASPAPNVGSVKVNHTGTKVFRVEVHDAAQAAVMNKAVDVLSLDLWTHLHAKPGTTVDVAVPANRLLEFESRMTKARMNVDVMHEDLEKSIQLEAETAFRASADGVPDWFNSYHSFDDHIKWLQEFAKEHEGNAEIVSSGRSLQGRDIQGIHLWGSGGKGSKPAIIWHGTVHAREWITTMVVEYLTWQIMNNRANPGDAGHDLLEKYDFYIFPVVNPDGFVYAQTSDRLWRKNRQSRRGASCIGTDINRNWNTHWSNRGGASTNPCAQDYKGEAPSDTVENQGLTAFMDRIAKREDGGQGVTAFCDWHSYSQLILTPFGYDCVNRPANDDVLQKLNKLMAAAIRETHGLSFTSGPSCSTIYKTTGDSVDYAFENSLIPHSMTVELRDTGRYGFVLPANQIVPSGEEAWAGVKAMYLSDLLDANVNSANPIGREKDQPISINPIFNSE